MPAPVAPSSPSTPLPSRLRIAGWTLAAAGGLAALGLLLSHGVRHPWDADFRLYYAVAELGRQAGWSHIYDQARLRPLQAAIGPGPYWPYANPPLLAWLATPFSYLSYPLAYGLWSALMAVVLAVAIWLARPAITADRLPWLLAATFWAYPVVFGLSEGQPVPFVALGLVAAWRLAGLGRDFAAGAALGLTLLKPHLAWLVPIAFLVAGRWRVLAGYATVAVLLALASAASVGVDGLHAWSADAQAVAADKPLQVFPGLLPEPWALIAELISLASTVVVLVRIRRRATPARLLAVGLVGSFLVSPHLNVQDLTLLILAGWLLWPEITSRTERWVSGAVLAAVLVTPASTALVIPAEAVWLVDSAR